MRRNSMKLTSKLKGVIIISIYDSGYGMSIIFNGRIYDDSTSALGRFIRRQYHSMSNLDFYKFLRNKYPHYHILVIDDSLVIQVQKGDF